MAYILLVRQTSKGVSPENTERFPRSVTFYLPNKNLPKGDPTLERRQAVAAWFATQPGLIKPEAPTFTVDLRHYVEAYVITQPWNQPERFSNWVTAWTATYKWASPLGSELHQVVEELRKLRRQGILQ